MIAPRNKHSGSQRIWGLDLLRAIAILSVLLYHLPKNSDQLFLRAVTHYGWAGVDLFFVLSGFLIAGQWFSHGVIRQTASLRTFYFRRLLRTLPNYFVILLVYILLNEFKGDAQSSLWKYFIFIQNFGIPGVFSQSWSLCVEEHFYLVFPFFVFACARSTRRAWLGFGTVFLGGIVLRTLIWLHHRPDLVYALNVDRGFEIYLSTLYYPTYTHLDGLAVGVSLAAVQNFRPALWNSWMKRGNFFLGLGLMLIIAAAIILRFKFGYFASVFGFLLLASAFGSLLISAVSKNSWINRFQIPGVETIAILSYSMYLVHFLAMEGAEWICREIHQSPYGWQMKVFYGAGILGLSTALYRIVELRFLNLRDRIL